MMTSEMRLAVVLVASVLLWAPALKALFAGNLGTGAAGVRYGASLALAWLAIAAFDAIVSGYRAEPAAEAGDGRRPAVGRRTDDLAVSVAEEDASAIEEPETGP